MRARTNAIAMIDGQLSLVDAGTVEGHRQFVQYQDGIVRLLDDQLEEIAAHELEASRVLAARGLEHLAVSDGSNLLILGAAPGTVAATGTPEAAVTVADVNCDAAAFVGDLLIATAPAAETHRVLLINPATGDVVDEATIDADGATAFIIPHPTELVVVIEFPMGQDGCVAQRVEVISGSLRVDEILCGQDPVIAGFNPSGTRLLVTPYPDDPETARVLAWPSMDEIGRLSADDLVTEIGIGLAACWINEERIAIYAMEDSLVVTNESLGEPVRARLLLDFRDEGDLETLVSLDAGRVAAGVWTPEGRFTLIFEI
ncbi:hypothetical protein [Rhodococcus sp. KBS0724]|uniref:hypothetical protein n=1 Tax=Rhodococcus sp. KBS0724 TaxID=1179674 RepID=UPI001C8F6284|nr:hypothetical protein [Rhodococcus sp. KBS0724]